MSSLNYSPAQLPLAYCDQAALGKVTGCSVVSAYGAIQNIGGSVVNVNVWQPQIAWTLPSAAVGIEYKSDSASDGVGGTGARKIVAIGVGPGFAAQTETVTMNGTTVVASAFTWMAINTLVVLDDPVNGFGSAKSNVGNISANVTGAGALHGYIVAGKSVSLHGRYTVPAGFTWLINNFFFQGNKSGSASASFGTDTITVSPNGLMLFGLPTTMQNGSILQLPLPTTPLPVAEKNTLMFRISSVSVASLDIACGCTGILVAN